MGVVGTRAGGGGLSTKDKNEVQDWMLAGHSIMNGKVSGTYEGKNRMVAVLMALLAGCDGSKGWDTYGEVIDAECGSITQKDNQNIVFTITKPGTYQVVALTGNVKGGNPKDPGWAEGTASGIITVKKGESKKVSAVLKIMGHLADRVNSASASCHSIALFEVFS